MPMYEFECKKCTKQWEEITKYDEKGRYPGVQCPECGSKRKTKIMTRAPHAMFTDPRSSSKWDNFSYRAGKTMEEAQDCRRNAEANSHMGANPYGNYDAQVAADINNDANWGEVK